MLSLSTHEGALEHEGLWSTSLSTKIHESRKIESVGSVANFRAILEKVCSGSDSEVLKPAEAAGRYRIMSGGLSAYEEQRAATIARNRDYLVKLGIDKPLIPTQPKTCLLYTSPSPRDS